MTERVEEPNHSDLAAITAEWPVIEAELGIVTAECRLAAAPDDLARHAYRRAVTDWRALVSPSSATRTSPPVLSALITAV